jgi:hypothetical protein
MTKHREIFTQFWRHYLQGHAHAGTWALHDLGTTLGLVGVAAGILTLNLWLVLGSIVLAYLVAWTGHFLVEHNHPCIYRHPLWSFLGDMPMLRYWLSGRLDPELRRAGHRSNLPLPNVSAAGVAMAQNANGRAYWDPGPRRRIAASQASGCRSIMDVGGGCRNP